MTMVTKLTMSSKAYSVILEHWMTHKIVILKVDDCKDMDECIEYIHKDYPQYTIERISPINDSNGK